MKRKTLGDIEISDGDQGVIQAVFATLNVKDHDGDVTLPGAFGQQDKVLISQYNHGTWKAGGIPIGIGSIRESDQKAIFTGEFFMQIPAARDTFEAIKSLKAAGHDTQYSYGYDVLDGERGMHDGQKANLLKKLKVFEMSPVLRGAGLGTGTLEVKSWKDFSDEEVVEEALKAFKALQERDLPIPDDLANAVRLGDRTTAEMKRQRDTVRGIALVHGFYQGEGT